MKRILALILALMMILSLAACGGTNDNNDTDPAETGDQGNEPEQTEPEQTEPEPTEPEQTVSTLTDEELVEKLAAIVDGKTGEMPLDTVSFATLSDYGVEVSGLFSNWFSGMAVPENVQIVINQPMIGVTPHIVLLLQPGEGVDINALEQELKDNANPRWNVCTEATFVESAVKDGLILFIMSRAVSEDGEPMVDCEGILAAFNA